MVVNIWMKTLLSNHTARLSHQSQNCLVTDEDLRGWNVSLQFTPLLCIAQQHPRLVQFVAWATTTWCHKLYHISAPSSPPSMLPLKLRVSSTSCHRSNYCFPLLLDFTAYLGRQHLQSLGSWTNAHPALSIHTPHTHMYPVRETKTLITLRGNFPS